MESKRPFLFSPFLSSFLSKLLNQEFGFIVWFGEKWGEVSIVEGLCKFQHALLKMRGKFGRGGRRTGQFVWQAFILDEVSKLGKMWLLVRLFDIRRGDVAAATALHSLFTGERDMALLLARFLPFFLLFFTSSSFTIDRFSGSR